MHFKKNILCIYMVHLSNPQVIAAMVLYSAITFFVMPVITRPFFKKYDDPCIMGFLIGFVISAVLWVKFGRHLAE